MTARLHIEIGNEAMSEPFHVAAALELLARKVESYGALTDGEAIRIEDSNGNTVGRFEVVA
jgi:hypothetical protein